MEKEGDHSGGWRFAQCFGDKGEVEDITEGECFVSCAVPDVLARSVWPGRFNRMRTCEGVKSQESQLWKGLGVSARWS